MADITANYHRMAPFL